MTALRQKAFSMIETIPEEKLLDIVDYITEYIHRNEEEERKKRIAMKKEAFDEILRMSKPLPNLDYEKELAEYRKERLGYANPN